VRVTRRNLAPMAAAMREPPDATETPRFSEPRTFARLPHTTDLEGVDAAIYGMPWDGSTSFRSGARYGPEAVRSMSAMLRGYNPVSHVQVFGAISAIDYGDAPTVPGYVEETLARIEHFVAGLSAPRVVGIGVGGDHSVTLAELRALAKAHGPLGLVHLDSHSDLWDSFFGKPYSHGTVFRRAIEDGAIDPARVVHAGMHGSLYAASDHDMPRELGVEMIPWSELAELTARAFGERVRRRVTGAPAVLTFDVDFVDVAFCPGTGTPEVGGPTSFQALGYLRALTGLDFVGYDVVEVAPQYDPGQVTALFAANVVFEMLSLIALSRTGRGEAAAAGERAGA
jgi:agmatinase